MPAKNARAFPENGRGRAHGCIVYRRWRVTAGGATRGGSPQGRTTKLNDFATGSLARDL
jgi:hypothetical protein